MDAEASCGTSKKRNRRIRDHLGLGRTQNLSDSSDEDDSHEKTNKRMRITAEHEQGPSGTGMSGNFNVINPLNPYQSVLRPEMSRPLSQYIEQSVGKDLQTTHAKFSPLYEKKRISCGYEHGERIQEPENTSLLESLPTRRPSPYSFSYHNPIFDWPHENDSAGNTDKIKPDKIDYEYNPTSALFAQPSTSYDLAESVAESDADDLPVTSRLQQVCEDASDVDSDGSVFSVEDDDDDDDVVILNQEMPRVRSDDDDDDVIVLPQDAAISEQQLVHSRRTVEPSVTLEGLSNGEVLPDSLSERARQCRTVQDFTLPMYSQEDIAKIEEKTRGQSDNPLWFHYHIGCIGASRFKTVVLWKGSMDREDVLVNKVKRVMGYIGPPPDHPNLVWGRNMEPIARQKYIEIQGRKGHEGIQVEECGVFFHPQKTFIGASPDGLVRCRSDCSACRGKDGDGILEIKCPVRDKDETPTPRNTGYLTQLPKGRIVLDQQHKYYHQVQTQLAVTGRPWCDFFVYKPGGCFLQRIRPRLRQWKFDALQAEQFFLKYIVPELVDRKLQKEMAKITPPGGS